MKLAAIYNVWDSLELLSHSIDSIWKHVDEIIIVWQKWSNWGEVGNFSEWDSNIVPFHHVAVVGKLHLINMEPTPGRMSTDYAMRFETAKRQAGIDKAVELGCTHFIGMDADELYRPDEFAAIKERINPKLSYACKIRVYYKEPTLCLNELDNTLVPFICPLPARTGIRTTNVLIDPTRRTAANYSVIPEDQIVMHHFSYVRKDGIETKLRNSTARKNIYQKQLIEEWEGAKEGTVPQNIYPGKELIRVENEFKIPTWAKS